MKFVGWVHIRYVLVILLITTAFSATIFVFWAQAAAEASPEALHAYQSDGQVRVTEEAGLITFESMEGSKLTGFIFYPGGRVDYRAYSPVLKMIAGRGYFVVLVPMPLNLAFFDVNAADQVIAEYPKIQHWTIGGHSLGGVAAARYATNHPLIEGLVLWASYPANDSLEKKDIRVLSIYGSEDSLSPRQKIDESRALLPADSIFVEISGGNHGQFGSYAHQAGDNPALISAEEQWTQVAEATSTFLDSISK